MPRTKILALSCATLLGLLFGMKSARAACATLPYTLTNGQSADANQVMANLNALLSCINSGSAAPGGSTNSLQYNAGNNTLGGVPPLGNGQVAVGVTGGSPQAASLTAGPGVVVTGAPGSITIGATGVGLYSSVMSATPTSSGTGLVNWVNQGAATVTDTPVGISIFSPGVTGDSYRIRTISSAPATPYSFTALVSLTAPFSNFQGVGFGWYNSSGNFELIVLNNNSSGSAVGLSLNVNCYNSPTSYNSSPYVGTFAGFPPLLWLKIRDDGTSAYFEYSLDGVNFVTAYSVAKASGCLGSSGYSLPMVGVSPNGGLAYGTVMSWSQGQ